MAGGLEQLALQGFEKLLRGVKQLRPGVFHVNPLEASYARPNVLTGLGTHMSDLSKMERLAEQAKDIEAAKKFGLLWSALRDAKLAGGRLTQDPDQRLIVALGKSGKPKAAASFDAVTGETLLPASRALDFTAEPELIGQLHSLGALSDVEDGVPRVTGSDLIREVQRAIGTNRLAFETIDKPEYSNLAFYRGLGAERVPGQSTTRGNPVMRFTSPARRTAPQVPRAEILEAVGQQRLPGFRRGGLTALRRP